MAEITKALREELMQTAAALADAARVETLAHFRAAGLEAENKLSDSIGGARVSDAGVSYVGGFDPVTCADRASETRMREILAVMRPDDAVLGEEFAPRAGTSGFTWVLDPIDGTRAYMSGAPTWGVLIAVNAGAGPV
ncbi:MAG: inositol monophosphatase family protein, partial [Albidovulum sp.]